MEDCKTGFNMKSLGVANLHAAGNATHWSSVRFAFALVLQSATLLL